MAGETAYLKQWHEAKKKTVKPQAQERPVGRFMHYVSAERVSQTIHKLPDIFRIVDNEFFPILEPFELGEKPVEAFAAEVEEKRGRAAEKLIQAGYPEAIIRGALALFDIPTVIISQAAINRRRKLRPDVKFHHLSEEERESVYFLSTWSQEVADYFIAFGEQNLSDQQEKQVYDAFVKQWLDYTKDAKDLIKKLEPSITDVEFSEANDFRGYKQGIWGSVGMVLDLFERGYAVRWSDPHTDVIRKIDMIAHRIDPETDREEVLAISCKAWANIDDHAFVQQPDDIAHAPANRQQQLEKEWRALSNGSDAFTKETGIAVEPMVAAIASRRQNPRSGRFVGSYGLT